MDREPERGAAARALYLSAGVVCVAVGIVGVVLPILPSTGPFVAAAWCFSRSSRRLEAWVLRLPKVGPLVRDYRAGLGMPIRAKWTAIVSIVAACSLSAAIALESWWLRTLVLALGAVGCVVVWRVPTKAPITP
jgi:uncharacterized protein